MAWYWTAFANGVTKDKAAMSGAITSGWSNGQTEGQIRNLALIDRPTHGRANLALFEAHAVGAA